MAQQYVAKDSRTGLEVAITGEFPPDKDDRIRIAATANLFTRLIATILATPNATERRTFLKSFEIALEWADAAIRQDGDEMETLMQRFLGDMGISTEQLDEVLRKLKESIDPDQPSGPSPN